MKKKLLIATAIAVAAVLIGGGVFAAFKLTPKTPEERVKLGFANMAREASQYASAFEENIDFDAIGKLKTEQPVFTDTDVSLTFADGDLNNVSFGVESLVDRSAKKAEYEIRAGMYGFDVTAACLAATPDTLYVSVPLFLDDTYSVDLDELGKKINDAEWSELLGDEIPEDYSIELFKDSDENNVLNELSEIISQNSDILTENAVYEELDEQDGDYLAVRVTVSADVVNEWFLSVKEGLLASDIYADNANLTELFESFTGYRLEEMEYLIYGDADFAIDFYFDKKGKIVAMRMPWEMAVGENESLLLEVSFLGEERTIDDISGSIAVKDGEDEGTVYFECQNDLENLSFSLLLSAEGEYSQAELSADGEFSDITKGKGYTFRINNACVSIDGEPKVYFSVTHELAVSDDEPEIPAEAVDVFSLSEEDIYQLVLEAMGKLSGFDLGSLGL